MKICKIQIYFFLYCFYAIDAVFAQTGVVVLGFSNARGNDEYKKNLFVREYCAIDSSAKRLKLKTLILTDPILCDGKTKIGICEETGCNFDDSSILKNFIKINHIKNLKVYILSHGVQDIMSYGRPPEKNQIDLGDNFQNMNANDLKLFFINALSYKLNSVQIYSAPCYGGGLHELSIGLIESGKVEKACSVSQSSHRRPVYISEAEVNSSTTLLFTDAFIKSFNSSVLKSLEQESIEESEKNYPSFPGMKAWITSSMYYIEKITKSGFFYEEGENYSSNTLNQYEKLKKFEIENYKDSYPISQPSYFPDGLHDFKTSDLLPIVDLSMSKFGINEKKVLSLIKSCEGDTYE